MKKRWTFELIVDTGFASDDKCNKELEEMSNDEATKRVQDWLELLFVNDEVEFELLKFETRNV